MSRGAAAATAIVTNAGGPGILAADECEASGLTLTELSDETQRRVSASLPDIAGGGNASAIVIFTPVEPGANREIVCAIGEGVAAGRRGRQAGARLRDGGSRTSASD